MIRPRMILSENRQMDWKRSGRNSRLQYTHRWHDGETTGSGADSAGASTVFRKREQVAPERASPALKSSWAGKGLK